MRQILSESSCHGLAALTGHTLSLNDMKQWGEAMPSWEGLVCDSGSGW